MQRYCIFVNWQRFCTTFFTQRGQKVAFFAEKQHFFAKKFRRLKIISLFCIWKVLTEQTKINITMKQYLGALLIILGTIMLVISYLSGVLVDLNWYQGIATALIILGVALHIYLLKKA